MKKQLLAGALALLLLTGCGKLDFGDLLGGEEPSGQPAEMAEVQSLSLPYHPGDSLDPYAAVGEMNLALTTLLYEPLFTVDEHFRPIGRLAQQVEQDGLAYTVTLREDAVFSDGTPVTAQAVVDSYRRTEEPAAAERYWLLHTSIEKVEAVGEDRVRFTAYRADKNLPALLSFPIVRQTADGEVLGSGRYLLQTESNAHFLAPNPRHSEAAALPARIDLTVLPDDATLPNALEAGILDCLYTDLSEPDDYGLGAKSFAVETGNVVYLGYNGSHALTGRPEIRRLLDAMLDRARIASDIYFNKATATALPFHPAYYDLPADYLPAQLTEEELRMQLELRGMTMNDAGTARTYDGKPIRLTLLVNGENEFKLRTAEQIARSLGLYGIGVQVESVDFTTYQQRLAAGDYDLFVAEVRLGPNQDLTPLLSGSSLGIAGDASDLALLEQYYAYCAGERTCTEFLEAFSGKLPVSPLVYRQGALMVDQSFSAVPVCTGLDIFYNLARW